MYKQADIHFFDVEIKIVNPDDPNIKPLQKKLPGIYITEKALTMSWSIPQLYCIYMYNVKIYHVCIGLEFFDIFLSHIIYEYWYMHMVLHVLGTMTVQKLKALIQRLYKADSEIKLSYVSKKAS